MSGENPTRDRDQFIDDSPNLDRHATDPADPGEPVESERDHHMERSPKTGGALDTAAAAPTTPGLVVNAGMQSDAGDDLLAPGDG